MSKRKRTPENPAYPLSEKDYENLFASLFRRKKYRHAAIVLVAGELGFRYVDLVRLTWDQVLNRKGKKLRIQEKKTGKFAERPITPLLTDPLEACLKGIGEDRGELIFKSPRGGAISNQSLNQSCKSWIPLYGLEIDPGAFSMHSFRKLAAMRIHDTKGVAAAQKFLNHSNISETSRYLLLSELDLENTILKANEGRSFSYG